VKKRVKQCQFQILSFLDFSEKEEEIKEHIEVVAKNRIMPN